MRHGGDRAELLGALRLVLSPACHAMAECSSMYIHDVRDSTHALLRSTIRPTLRL